MPITDLVAPEAILPALKVNSKKQALQELAAKAAELTGQNERAVFEVLLQREKLGTTAVGYGVAIPHGKLPKLEKIFGLFARLDRPIDFESMDGQPVDLVFLLLAPEGAGADHLKALARIARLLRDQDIAKKPAPRATPRRSIRCWRCRRPPRHNNSRLFEPGRAVCDLRRSGALSVGFCTRPDRLRRTRGFQQRARAAAERPMGRRHGARRTWLCEVMRE